MDFFDIHTHNNKPVKNVFSIVNKYPTATNFANPFSIGIHPWFINKNKIDEEFLIIEEKIQHKNCLAIGECGLDKLTETDFELQQKVFRQHILLSEKYKKPLLIHCVKSHQEVIAFKKELQPTQPWVLHGFNKNVHIAESLLKNKLILSFGAVIINTIKLEEVVSKTPISSIFLETDTAEVQIQSIYQKLAVIKNIEVITLQKEIKNNFTKIFKR